MLRHLVTDAVATLPTQQRQAIALAYYGELTQTEIARVTNVPWTRASERSLRPRRARQRGAATGSGRHAPPNPPPRVAARDRIWRL